MSTARMEVGIGLSLIGSASGALSIALVTVARHPNDALVTVGIMGAITLFGMWMVWDTVADLDRARTALRQELATVTHAPAVQASAHGVPTTVLRPDEEEETL